MDTSHKSDNKNELICDETNTPYIRLEQGDVPCLFIHANGYPSACYLPLLKQLKGYDVIAPLSRACWDDRDPNGTNQWLVLVDDLINFAQAKFNKTQQPFQCIGHSMGAIILLMAIERKPSLFDKIVFIDPIFLSSLLISFLKFIPESITKQSKLVNKTLSRPRQWESLQQAFEFHRPKRAFQALPDKALWKYIIGGTKAIDDEWHLRYDTRWEAWFYHHLPNPWPLLRKLNKPTLGLRAQNSEFLTEKCWNKWQKIQFKGTFIEFQGQHHLLPMEAPQDVAHAILEFFE